jgi:hypothetical protein
VIDLQRLLEEELRRERALLKRMETAARSSDIETFVDGLDAVEFVTNGWPRLLRRIANMPDRPSADFRTMFEMVMSRWGDHLRQEGDDLALIKALRAIFPPYRSGPLRLYRGEFAFNRRRRTYGLSWTRDRSVAEGFARGYQQTFPGGSVLLETDAPAAAIIRIPRAERYAGEREVWVDRRRLDKVRVLERYPH